MLYSFDIFDTLITRRVAEPKGIFAVMQETLHSDERYWEIDEHIRDNFYQLRINSEALARANYQRKGVEDITLEQIYRAMGTTGDLDASGQALLMALEKETELAHVVGIAENIARVKKLLAAGERVILISDMYLDSASIREMLLRADEAFADVPIYVSSEQQKGKYTGWLYYKIRDLEKVSFDVWKHFGDNEHSDIDVPGRIGISTEKYTPPAFLPIEENRLRTHADSAETQRIIGTARALRFNCRMGLPETIGTSVGAPILFAYAAWILREAQKNKIARLYFVARDGYIPKLIVDKLIEDWRIQGIETHYIYGSRRAWKMPSYDGKPGTLRWMTAIAYAGGLTTVAKIARYLQVEPESLLPFLPKEYQSLERELSWLEVCLCFWYMEKQPEFRTFLHEKMTAHRNLVRRYLEQEIDTHDEHFAFVDLEGRGVTQICFSKIMREFCRFPVRTFFFSLWEITHEDFCANYNFMPSFLQHNILIEVMCRAPHGQTDGYEEGPDGRIVPVLRQDESMKLEESGYNEYIRGVENFIRMFGEGRPVSVGVDFVLSYLEYVASFADETLSEYFAALPNTATGREKKIVEFAPRLTKKEIRQIFLFATGSVDQYYAGTDLLLSQKRCSPSEQRRIKRYQEQRMAILVRYEQLFHRSLIADTASATSDAMRAIFCFDGVRRVALYGAGRYGHRLYEQFKTSGVEIVAWMDKNAEQLQKQGMPVTGTIDSLGDTAFDKLFILILDEHISKTVKQEFLERGVPEEKIVTGAFWQYQAKWERYLSFEWI